MSKHMSASSSCGCTRKTNSSRLAVALSLVSIFLIAIHGAVGSGSGNVLYGRVRGDLGFVNLINRPAALRSNSFLNAPTTRVSYTASSSVVKSVNHTSRSSTELRVSIQSADGLMGTAPFPFVERPPNLPGLTSTDLMALRSGERVQKQIRNGLMGTGFVVVDVKAPPAKVWASLLDFDRYATMVPTIKNVKIRSKFKNTTKGIFCLSKFRFKVAVVHRYQPEKNRLDFYLDPDMSQYGNILEMAEGYWYCEQAEGRPEGWTRVFMTAKVKVNRLVPIWLVEYAAERALVRASAWLKPYMESLP